MREEIEYIEDSQDIDWVAEAYYLYGMASDDRNDSSLILPRCLLLLSATQIAIAEAANRQATALEKIADRLVTVVEGK